MRAVATHLLRIGSSAKGVSSHNPSLHLHFGLAFQDCLTTSAQLQKPLLRPNGIVEQNEDSIGSVIGHGEIGEAIAVEIPNLCIGCSVRHKG
jgi:hypothetical protein